MSANTRLRPSRRAIALEPRLLFDGAGAVAGADALVDDWNEVDNPVEAPSDAAPSDDTQTVLVVIDARVADHELLSTDLPANITVRIVGEEESGLAVTGEALANGHNGSLFDAIHIVSHGKPGSLTLGNDVISNENLDDYSAELQAWALHLSMDADILLYGCDIAAGDDGEAFITELARLTEADIAASTDPTGASDQGGNWILESQTGPIEAGIVFSETVMEGYGELLDSSETPTPTVDIQLDDREVLIGEEFTFELNFNNPKGATGYGPYIDLYLPKGFDGDDGISIAENGAITYLGQSVNYTIHQVGEDHPYAKDTEGNPLKITGDEGDDIGQVIVIELPFGSYTTDQPEANLMVTATLSNLADVGEGKNLTIKANAGFRYGKTPIEDYATDPSIVGEEITLEITPSVVEYEFTYNGPENETASGSNFPRSVTTTIKVAPGQTLNDYTFTVDVPNNVVVTGYTVDNADKVDLEESIQGRSLNLSLDNISGEHNVTLHYFVPEHDSNGNPVLDPTHGGTVMAEFHISGSGDWTPLDDRNKPQRVEFNPETVEIEHEIKPLAVQKRVEITNDTGAPGATPGDTLTYTIDFQVSDFFSFEDIVITDTLRDGHGDIEDIGNITLTITHQGQDITLNLSSNDWYGITTPGADGDTTIAFDISQALKDSGLDGVLAEGILEGGQYGDTDHDGATIGTITYTTTIADRYTAKNAGASIHQNDRLISDVEIQGTIRPVDNPESGKQISDGSGTAVDMADGSLNLKVAKVNGEDPVEGGIKPGDTVTYELTYHLATGDYRDLVLDAYLPKPVFDVGTADSWTQATDGLPTDGQWQLVSDLEGVVVNSVDVDQTNNKLTFKLDDRDDTNNKPATIILRFTTTVSEEPFADNLFLTAQARASDSNSEDHTATDLDIDRIRLNQPVLTVKHGIVSNTEHGKIDGTSGTWTDPGSSGAPFTGNITDITAVDGNLSGFDAGDRVVFALGIQNNGGSAAYDVQTTTITAPEGFSFAKVNGEATDNLKEANLKIFRGDGTELQKGTDYTVNDGTITFNNTENGVIGAARDSGGNAVNDGSNIIIITYDAIAEDDIIAGDETTSDTGVESYTSVPSGIDFLPGEQNITDTAKATVAEPEVKIVFKDGSISDDDTTADHTTGADVVIGEAVEYDIVVTLPEGKTHDLQVNLDVPDGMKLDTSFGDGGYKIISEQGTADDQSGALVANFVGTLGDLTIAENDGKPGQNPLFTFAQITTDSNEINDNSFVIRVRLIADNVEGNRAGDTLTPVVSATYNKGSDDPNTTIKSTENNTTVRVLEPKLTIEKVVDTNPNVDGTQSDPIDAGDKVTYTITISNKSGVDAFDLAFQDDFAGMLEGLDSNWTAVKTGSGITDLDVTALFEWTGDGDRTLQTTSGADLDLADGQEIVITVTATTNASAAAVSSFDSEAIVTWSSIDSTDNSAGNRDENERDGSIEDPENTLNNYIATDNAKVEIVSSNTLSRVGGLADTNTDDDTAEGGADLAIGEIVRFRMVIQVPEGEIPDMSVLLNLPDGYEYLGEARIALIADSDDGLTAGSLEKRVLTKGNEELQDLVGNIDANLTTDNQDDRNSATYPGHLIIAGETDDGKPVFNLGTVTNHDDDPDKEFIVIEFNAIVANTVDNSAGTELKTSFVVKSGDTELSSSNETVDTLVEPRLSAVEKTVVGMEGDDNTRTLIVRNSFNVENDTHNSHAYDVILTDRFPKGEEYKFASLTVDDKTYTSIEDALENGIEINIDNPDSKVTVTFDKLDRGSKVELQYKVKVPANEAQSPDGAKATLTWSSLPGESEDLKFIGSSPEEAGAPKGERDHSGIANGDDPNNYQTTGQAGYGIISGTLWDDTINQNGTPDGSEIRLAGATVTITWAGPDGIFDDGDDVSFTTKTDQDGNYSFGGLPAGKYKIEGPGTFTQEYGDYDTDDLTPRSDPDGDANTLGTFIVELGDGTTVIEQNIGYLQVNDAPSFKGVDGTAVDYTEGVNTPEDQGVLGTPVHLAPTGEIFDPEIVGHGLDNFDGTTLTVSRSAGTGFSAHTDDVLGLDFGDTSTLTLSGSEITHNDKPIGRVNTDTDGLLIITFTADATSDTVNEVLQAITYANRSDTPDETVDIRFRFNDNNQDDIQGSGGALDGDAVVTVNITAKNDPPVAVDDTNSLNRDHEEPIKGNVITGEHTNDKGDPENSTPDSDPETPGDLRITHISVTTDTGDPSSDPRGYDFDGAGPEDSITVVGEYGTLIIHPNGEYNYELDTNNPDVYGLDSGDLKETFLYTLSDGDDDEGTDTATLTITIHGDAIDPPSISPVDHTSEIDGHNIVYEAGLRPDTDKDENTGESIATGEITVTAKGGITSVNIGGTTIPVEDLHNTGTSPITIYSDGSEDDSAWKLEIIGFTPKAGEPDAAPREGKIEYQFTLLQPIENDQPDSDYYDAPISLTVTDQANQPSDATLTIRIVDDQPEARDDTSTVANDTNSASGNVLGGDDKGEGDVQDVVGADGATVTAIEFTDADGKTTTAAIPENDPVEIEGEHGKLTIYSDGRYTYKREHDTPLEASDVFTYTITDGDGDKATARLTINIADKGPIVTDDPGGEPIVPEPTDPTDPDSPTRLVVQPDGKVKESGLTDGSNPDLEDRTTTGTITFTPGDGPHTVTVGGEPVTGKGQEFTTPSGVVTITHFDPENGTIEYTYELTTPTSGDDSTDEFDVTIKDDDGDDTTVTVVIDIINDGPVANPDTIELTFGDQDSVSENVFANDNIGADGEPDSGPVTGISEGSAGTPTDGVGTPVHGRFGTIIIDPNGNYTYTPDPDNDDLLALPGGETVEEVFTYTITDSDGDTSTATLSITIHGNTPPVAEPDVLTIPEDTTGTGNVLENDRDADDGDELKVTGFTIENVPGENNPGVPVDIPGVGTITIDEEGNYSFTPVKDWNGDVPVITYTVTDGKGDRGTTTSTLNITVTPVPDAFDDDISTESGMPITFDPTGNDTFSNPDKEITDVTQGSNGKVTITPDGRVTYTPNPGFEGTDTFTYTVTSGGITETATVTVTVRGVHTDVPPPAFGDYTPPSQTPTTPGNPLARDVVRDASVFFEDQSFDRVDRMQLPFHPIAYVNRQVQVAQDERAGTDVRFLSNPSVVQHGEAQSRSIGAGLGADPNLFVQHAIRDAQTRADFLASVIDGRLGRTGLSSDGILPSPELFQADAGQLVPGTKPAPETQSAEQDNRVPEANETPQQGAQDNADAAPDTNNAGAGQGDATAELSRLDVSAEQSDVTADQVRESLIGRGALSFTEQLKGGRARLPATLFTPHRDV